VVIWVVTPVVRRQVHVSEEYIASIFRAKDAKKQELVKLGAASVGFFGSPRVKQPEREADRSPSTSAEVKKTWIYTSVPPYAFME
jgi:hypothetical protein